MTRIIRLLSITATAALALITTSLYGQGAGRAPDLSPAPAVQAKVVRSTVAPPPVPQPAPRAGAPEGKIDPATEYRKRKIAEISSKVQESLSIGPPDGLNQFMTKLRAKKKSKIDRTKLVNRILADGIAARQFAKNDPQSLSTESLNAALDGITEEDVATFIRERFERLTGLKVPEDKQRLLEHIKKQNAQAKQVLSQAPEVIALAPVRVPTKDMPAFNWTLPGFAAKSTGIVTAVQNQDPDRDCSPGSCWAFATVGAFEAAYAKANGVLIGASEQYLLNCAGPVLSQSSDPILRAQPWSCEGGWWAFPMLVPSDVQNAGLPLRVQLPFTGSSGPCPASMDKPYQAKTWGYVTDGFNIPPDDVLKGALLRARSASRCAVRRSSLDP